MKSLAAVGGLLVLCALQTGCCTMCGSDWGCGRSYWGAYCDDPPGCEPCNRCGDWTGHGCGGGVRGGCCNPCESRFPWMRAGLLDALLCCKRSHGCCEPACGEPACGEPTCAPSCEPACGEPGCGEPGCGCTSCGHAGGGVAMTSSAPIWSGYTRNVSYRTAPRVGTPSKPCNCDH